MNYDVVLFQYVSGSKDESFSVQMTKRLQLPFVPQCDISLGLWECSEFRCDECLVKRVMWQAHYQEFHLEIKELRGHPQHMVKWLAEDGWIVKLGYGFDDKAEASKSSQDDPKYEEAVVCINGRYYTVTPSELWAMHTTNQPFQIVTKPQT